MNNQLINQYLSLKNKSEQSLMTWASGLSKKEFQSLVESLRDAGYMIEADELEEDFS